MSTMPINQSLPDAHRASAYGRITRAAELTNIAERSAPKNVTLSLIACPANANATTASGWVRRHNKLSADPTPIASASTGHPRSLRSTTSSTVAQSRTTLSAQSRHTLRGGSGTRGLSHSLRTASITTTSA